MRKLTYLVAATIDGFIAADSDEDPTGDVFRVDGDEAAYLISEFPEMIPTHLREPLGVTAEPRVFDTVLEGANSYRMALKDGVANGYRHLEHYVFSRTMAGVPDPAIHVSDDPLGTVRELKRKEGKGIWLVGGGGLARSLLPEIDEIIVKQHPIVLGSGVPMFGEPRELVRFSLTASTLFDSGVAVLSYARS
ncbi:dihydrofolate reductase [Herbihabitans rhizosphaerae]|uniref:Dihydrofolate reductase n=1 Tax=Herbihabitans rhizosphaerae TaxID=1872711 RepID=A0A4Q7L5H2_9PSEU|nr:dihydrofolate reductase family protein [Herbihabitans rhizosphaerae]RZS44879.1 dihydrofolate reductase [Herbihabitans rhizosphaerae]